jgi:hypothetical protein
MARIKTKGDEDSTANLDFEAKLWPAADMFIFGQQSNATMRCLAIMNLVMN